MKLKVDVVTSYGRLMGYAVYKHHWLWGWERYDRMDYSTYGDALKHAKDIKELGL